MRPIGDLKRVAHHIGYEWAMLLGAADSDWHLPEVLTHHGFPARAPLRVVHLHARTELVWLHARVLYGFLFKTPRGDDLSVLDFLDDPDRGKWRKDVGFRAVDLCPDVKSHCVYDGLANKKLFHATAPRLSDPNSLPGYDIVRDQLRRAFAKCYSMMNGDKKAAFRDGLDDEWDVSAVALTAP